MAKAEPSACLPDIATGNEEPVIRQMLWGSFSLVDENGAVLATRRRGEEPVISLPQSAIVAALHRPGPSADQIVAMWDFLANEDHADLVTLPIVRALAAATRTPVTREALWSELAELSKPPKGARRASARTLLNLFERHRDELLALIPPIRETEGGGDEMARLMTSTRVFGKTIEQSLDHMVARNPGAVARMIERERERGRPVPWEDRGFAAMMRWKEAHLVSGAPQAPRTIETLDCVGETFITIFNALHSLDERYRKQMLRGLGPVELFNAAVGGEQELYRLGTSGYRDYLHPTILEGIKRSGSFGAFLERAAPSWLGETGPATRSRRSMVFVRIASSFGMLDSVLDWVRDRNRFIEEAISALGDPRAFEGSTTIVLDLLTIPAVTPRAAEFKSDLLNRLFDRYRTEASAERRSVFGSMLSAYQTVTGDRRDVGIDRDFPLDRSLLHVPFDRLFETPGNGRLTHRMFMRLHDDIDAAVTYKSFRTAMRSLGARIHKHENYTLYRLEKRRRIIEIYVNKPSEAGIDLGIGDIGKALGGNTVHTVIGRGHTGIITPLQADARRLLGERIANVAAVVVGSCGSDASARDMIGTFGTVPIVTTKSTGRRVINNAIVESYIKALLDLPKDTALSITSLVDTSLSQFLTPKTDEELREDAKLYRVNLAVVLAAQLFDTHVHRQTRLQRSASE